LLKKYFSRNKYIKFKNFSIIEIVFCCYNCLDLPWEIFFQVWVTCFPSSWEQEQCWFDLILTLFTTFPTLSYEYRNNMKNRFVFPCWEKVVQVWGRRPRICDLFKTLFLLERTGKTSNEY
jgi:hypothetical protein